jgi:hypothetical protein
MWSNQYIYIYICMYDPVLCIRMQNLYRLSRWLPRRRRSPRWVRRGGLRLAQRTEARILVILRRGEPESTGGQGRRVVSGDRRGLRRRRRRRRAARDEAAPLVYLRGWPATKLAYGTKAWGAVDVFTCLRESSALV